MKILRRYRIISIFNQKIKHYFGYAIGEILLVVIGILIALQVNLINERNKRRQAETTLLTEIKHSLESDLENLNSDINALERWYKSQTYIIDWLESDREFNDTLSIHVNRTFYRVWIPLNRISYEVLKKEKYKTEQNKGMVDKVAILYDIEYFSYTYFNDLYEKEAFSHYKECQKHFTELGFGCRSSKPINSATLKADKTFLAKLRSLRNLNIYYRESTLEEIKDEIEQTIKFLDENLKETKS